MRIPDANHYLQADRPDSLARAADKINDRYGEFTVTPALMASMDDVIIKRVPFGSVRDI